MWCRASWTETAQQGTNTLTEVNSNLYQPRGQCSTAPVTNDQQGSSKYAISMWIQPWTKPVIATQPHGAMVNNHSTVQHETVAEFPFFVCQQKRQPRLPIRQSVSFSLQLQFFGVFKSPVGSGGY